MSIRDTSYYGFSTVLEIGPTNANVYHTGGFFDINSNTNGRVYVAGRQDVSDFDTAKVKLFGSADGSRFTELYSVDDFVGTDSRRNFPAVDTDTSGNIYFVGAGQVWRSADYGKTFSSSITIGSLFDITNHLRVSRVDNRIITFTNDFDFDSETVIYSSSNGTSWSDGVALAYQPGRYIAFGSGSANATNSIFISTGGRLDDIPANSTTTATILSCSAGKSNWLTIANASYTTAAASNKLLGLMVDSNYRLYHYGSIKRADTGKWVLMVRSSSDGGGSWGSSSFGESNTDYFGIAGDTDSENNVYVAGISGSNSFLLKSVDRGVTWNNVYSIIGYKTTAFHIDSKDNIYWALQSGKTSILKKGRFTSNSASLGPMMLATSFGYMKSEISGTAEEAFKLNNVSEFPHAGGLFQMKNMILGTTDSGKIGRDSDAIIQVKHLGSVVYVMWPKQADQDIPVRGFGDLSIGQRSGKLTTTHVPGEVVDVTPFDHLALYCALRKEASGTLDNIEIKIERRPLKSVGFSTEQTVEYAASGSVTVARLSDLVFKKEINYGDLDIREVAFPIDVPLVNVKELRVSARHIVGQEDVNKNFIIWGRLIKSSKDTNET
jgi:hypothetical protein